MALPNRLCAHAQAEHVFMQQQQTPCSGKRKHFATFEFGAAATRKLATTGTSGKALHYSCSGHFFGLYQQRLVYFFSIQGWL
jgi:hypothetical protein